MQKLTHEQEEEAEFDEATKLADQDYDGDGTIETPAAEHKGSVDKAIKKSISERACSKGEENEEDNIINCPECDGQNKICPVCKGGGKVYAGDNSPVGVVDESMQTYKVNNYTSWEDDEKKAVNVADGSNKTNPAFPKDQQVKSDPKSTDAPDKDKDESPSQTHALDTPSQQDQSGGGDLERKVNVPAALKTALKREAAEARKEAKAMTVSNRDASYFYDDLARMFDDLHMYLDQGTVHDLKSAAVFMTSLMGPMLHKIPAEVVDFIAKGGQTRSLKSYMSKVDAKYPITGPRNALK